MASTVGGYATLRTLYVRGPSEWDEKSEQKTRNPEQEIEISVSAAPEPSRAEPPVYSRRK
jgi:hypothetical protein